MMCLASFGIIRVAVLRYPIVWSLAWGDILVVVFAVDNLYSGTRKINEPVAVFSKSAI